MSTIEAGLVDVLCVQAVTMNAFSSPETELPWKTEQIRPASNSRKAIKDMKTALLQLKLLMILAVFAIANMVW